MDLSWTTDECGGLALVAARVHNRGTVPRRVRLDNRLDGPVLPPRRGGVPEPGFDADGITLGVPPDGTRAVGFACPAPTREPPLAIVDAERIADATAVPESDSTAGALGELGHARPPRDAVPKPDENSDRRTHERNGDACPGSDDDAGGEAGDGPPWDGGRVATDSVGTRPHRSTTEAAAGPPVALAGWLDDVEERIEYGERLTDASVPEATGVLRECGGLSAVDRLDARLHDDVRALRAVADRATALAERAETTDVPLDALGRLA